MLAALVALWGLTAAGSLAARVAPGLVAAVDRTLSPLGLSLTPLGRPHPALHPTLSAILQILTVNVRVLCAPFILALSRFGSARRARPFADVVIAAILGSNALRVGLALGRWQGRLLPYLPQLPLEYLAAAVAASTWAGARRGALDSRQLAPRFAVTVALLAVAATVEVLLTPHARR